MLTQSSMFVSKGSAIFSPDEAHRYILGRELGKGEKTVTFIMLNPSTATAELNDPTITRCIGYARAWGYGRLMIGNIFALRSTDPKALYTHPDPIGPDNDMHLRCLAIVSDLIVMAYGAHGAFMDRGHQVMEMLLKEGHDLHYLSMTKDGHPGHPLFLKASLTPQKLERKAA